MNIKLLDRISKEKKLWTILFIGWVMVGITTSIFDSSLKSSYIYVIAINGLIFAQYLTYQALKWKESKLLVSLSELEKKSHLSIVNKFGAYLNKWYSLVISFVVGAIYIFSFILQKILIWNAPITLYGSITLILAVFIAIQLLLKYVLYTLALREIAEGYPGSFKEKFVKSVWILNFEELLKSFSIYFILFGIIYTALFELTQISVETSAHPSAATVSWGIIIIVMGLGWVILNTTRIFYLKRILNALDSEKSQKPEIIEDSVN